MVEHPNLSDECITQVQKNDGGNGWKRRDRSATCLSLARGDAGKCPMVTSDASGLAIQGGSLFEMLKAKAAALNGAAVACKVAGPVDYALIAPRFFSIAW
ncbi:hypothetical protein [Bordetella sp. H567]|uniref:hypothetical protein n=1 Tax=Bordetella sp. H567 TaxID=1697043 RepID=UPI0011AB71B9|nr:hypothetical protein [Bordetella sp. H567]